MIEFGEQDSPVIDEVMDVLKRHPDFDCQQLDDDSVLSIPGLEIYPNRRKIYRGRKEINLVAKNLTAKLVQIEKEVEAYEAAKAAHERKAKKGWRR